MRPEMREYNWDWMLGSMIHIAAGLDKASPLELTHMLRYVPYFSDTMGMFARLGDPAWHFVRMLDVYMQRVLAAKSQGKKICMTTFCFCPIILEAYGLVPLMIEQLTGLIAGMYRRGAHDYMDYCVELGFSETGCSSQRGMLGAYLAGLGEEVDIVIGSMGGVCDSNSNAYAFGAERLNVPFYNLNYPSEITGKEVWEYQVSDYKAMMAFVEKATGSTLDEDRLRDLLAEKAKQDAIMNRIEEMQIMRPNPLRPALLLLLYAGNLMCPGWPEYTALLQSIESDMIARAAAGLSGSTSGIERNRTFFFYIDHTGLSLSFWSWLEEHGISHLGGVPSRTFADTAPYVKGSPPGAVYHIDTSTRESMIESLVGINATMPMSRTIRGPHDAPHMWLSDTLALCEMYGADSCIYAGTPGCRNTWSNVKLMVQALEKAGYPSHIMTSDTFDIRVESWETTSARLEEFYQVRGLWK
ncbi:MAG: 2-hydroxyacyl-CoA dehydratase family protein [Thermodesulfobacteriota bacterium]